MGLSRRTTAGVGVCSRPWRASSVMVAARSNGAAVFRQIVLTALALILACSGRPIAAQPGAITSLKAIRALSQADLRQLRPVAFEATVTYYNRSDVDLFVEDGEDAIYVETHPNEDLRPGDRVM